MSDRRPTSSSSKNCAVNEMTADGVRVGRCWEYVGDKMICSRHGDVSGVQAHFMESGKLTDECALSSPPQDETGS